MYPNLDIAWECISSETVGGDVIDVIRLDETHYGIYMADVSGHGLSSALITVSISEIFQKYKDVVVPGESKRVLLSPKDVLNIFDREYPLGKFSLFITLVYLVIDVETGILSYSNAGHPLPLLISKKRGVEILEKRGGIIGFGHWAPFEEEIKLLEKGDKVILYTDGVYESQDADGNFYGIEYFYNLINLLKDEPSRVIVDAVVDSIKKFQQTAPLMDDLSLMCMEWR